MRSARLVLAVAIAATGCTQTGAVSTDTTVPAPATSSDAGTFNPPETTTTTTTVADADDVVASGPLERILDPVIDGGRTDAEAEAETGTQAFDPTAEDLAAAQVLADMYRQRRQIRFESLNVLDPDYPGLDWYAADGGDASRRSVERHIADNERWVLGGDAVSTPEYWAENIRMRLQLFGREQVAFEFCTTIWQYRVDASTGEVLTANPGPYLPSLRGVTFRRLEDGHWAVVEETNSIVDETCTNDDSFNL